jgi:hypothetical protein
VTTEPVIVDSSTLLNFVLTGSLDLLLDLPEFSFRIPPRVYAEIEPERGRELFLPAIEQASLLGEGGNHRRERRHKLLDNREFVRLIIWCIGAWCVA